MTNLLPSDAGAESARTDRAATAALLDGYLSDVRKLVSGDADPQLHASLQGELLAIGRSSGLRPELSLTWLHLLIAHTELAHGVSTDEHAHCAVSTLERRRQLERVCEAARELRHRWLRLQDVSPLSRERSIGNPPALTPRGRGHAPGGRRHAAARRRGGDHSMVATALAPSATELAAERTLDVATTRQPQPAPASPGSGGQQPDRGSGQTGSDAEPRPKDTPAPAGRRPVIEQKPRLPRQS